MEQVPIAKAHLRKNQPGLFLGLSRDKQFDERAASRQERRPKLSVGFVVPRRVGPLEIGLALSAHMQRRALRQPKGGEAEIQVGRPR